MAGKAAVTIRALAQFYNIAYHPSHLDNLATDITRLSGDNVTLDDVEYLLIELGRRGVISRRTALAMQHGYLKEKSGRALPAI